MPAARPFRAGEPEPAGAWAPDILDDAVAQLAEAASFQVEGETGAVDELAAEAVKLGWEAVEVPWPEMEPGKGWTVYAPVAVMPKRVKITVSAKSTREDMRAFLAAVAPRFGMVMEIRIYRADGSEIGD